MVIIDTNTQDTVNIIQHGYTSMKFSPNGKHLITKTNDKTLNLIDISKLI